MQKKIIQKSCNECLSTGYELLFSVKTFGKQVERIAESLCLPYPTFSPNVKTQVLLIITDDADIYEKEINLLLSHEKYAYVHPLIFDINEKGKNWQKYSREWSSYNILSGKVIGNLFLFIEEYLSNIGLISFDLNDLRWALSNGTFLNVTKLEGDIHQLLTSFQPRECNALVLGINIPNQGEDEMQKSLNVVNDFFTHFRDETEIKWALNFCKGESHFLIIEVQETGMF